MKEIWKLSRVCEVQAHSGLCPDTLKKLWYSFSCHESELTVSPVEQLYIRTGDVALPSLPTKAEYALSVTPSGAAVVGRDRDGLMRGFCALVLLIECEEQGALLPCREYVGEYRLKRRMLHLCIFPEQTLQQIKKLIRLAGVCQYTHVVLEFWGMLQYDCLPELAWPQAFSKQQARELIDECRAFGMQPVPMFNQLGHATASRLLSGKHVVLDQAPSYQPLFTPDGWCWNITSPRVKQLLKEVRCELYDLFGKGEYMHIGCDEAYYITHHDGLRATLPAYLKELTCDVVGEGRRPMMWMDMLLEEGKYPDCYTTGRANEVEKLREATHPATVFVDWQYDRMQAPIPSLLALRGCQRDVMGAPWYKEENIRAQVETLTAEGMYGIMMTTWHTLSQYAPSILYCAEQLGAAGPAWGIYSSMYEKTAVLLRRVSLEGNTYAECGWCTDQISMMPR